jgi:phosphatidylglycerophosphatase C
MSISCIGAHGLELICSKLEVLDGVLTGRYDGAQCVREEKPRRVRERYAVENFDTVYAYGDTPEDFALLEIAEHRWYRGKRML